MKFFFHPLSIKKKITLVTFFVTFASISTALSIIAYIQIQMYKKDFIHEIQIIGKMVSEHISAAVIFDDREGGSEIIKKVESLPFIVEVAVYNPSGELFVHYQKKDSRQRITKKHYSESDTYSEFEHQYVIQRMKVGNPTNSIGTLVIVSQLDPVKEKKQQLLLSILGIFIVLQPFFFILGIWLKKIIVIPIMNLLTTVQRISSEKQYSQKAAKISDDELGELCDGFNDMIEQIQIREQDLKILNDQLENRVQERTKLLENSYKKIRDTQAQLVQAGKLASLGTMGAGLAHELNNPLSVIQGFVEETIYELKSEKPDTQEVNKMMQEVLQAVQRIQKITSHMLEFSRDQKTTNFLQMSVNKPVMDSLIFIDKQLKNRNIQVILNLQQDIYPIHGNSTKLESVFLNLLSNARDAFENSKNSTKNIVVTTKNISDTSIQITISDNAGGIPDDIKDKIFDPFFTTKEVGKGTGLGLYLVYSIIEEHKGTVDVNSQLNEGTTFVITIPRYKEYVHNNNNLEQ